jgi:hypothetical protein
VYGNRFPGIEYRMPAVRRHAGWPLRDSHPGIFVASASYRSDSRPCSSGCSVIW